MNTADQGQELTQEEKVQVEGGDIVIKDGNKTLLEIGNPLDISIDIKPFLDLFR